MGKPTRVMMVPYPAQGDVIPLLELAHILASHNIPITFVLTQSIHDLIIVNSDASDSRIRFVSITNPDVFTKPGKIESPAKFIEALQRAIPEKIEKLVQELHENEEENISCLVYDHHLSAIQEVAKKMGIQSAAFLPVAAAGLVLSLHIPKLIEDGIIDDQGTALQHKSIQLAPTMPIMNPSDFVWNRNIRTVRKLIFDIFRKESELINSADWVICNSIYDLEQGAFTLAPQIVPIGLLLARNSAGSFLKQDLDCLEWLDQQPPCSVIYVAFGSTAKLSNTQLQELALGLEQTNRPFLWVVRLDHTEKQEFPEGFVERVSRRGRIVGWSPQLKVLSHPSIACFVSHCGWNSTIESVSSGVPVLCWPYFSDQFINQSYICDIWRVGLPFEHDDSGNITSEEFQKKIDLLLGDGDVKERALQLKETIESSAKEEGSSYKNLRNFISWIQE